ARSGCLSLASRSTWRPAARSLTCAEVTVRARRKPQVSTTRLRFLPRQCLNLSNPMASPPSADCTDWASREQAVGSGARPCAWRTWGIQRVGAAPPGAVLGRDRDPPVGDPPRDRVVRQLPPLAAGPQQVEDRVQDLPPVIFHRTARPGLGPGQQDRFDDGECLVTDIAVVALAAVIPVTVVAFRHKNVRLRRGGPLFYWGAARPRPTGARKGP